MKPSRVGASNISLVLILLLVASPSSPPILLCEAKLLNCVDVVGHVTTCLPYFVGGINKPPSSCCEGAKALVSATASVEDKRTACNCIKNTAQVVPLKQENVEDFPNICGVEFPYQFSPTLDCTR